MKNFLFKITIILLILFSTSCKKESTANVHIKRINVDVQKKYSKGNFEDYFSSSKVISLETNERSIFSSIDRAGLYDNKIFILDRKTNAVLIFSNTGKFLNKIQTIGKGPREYISLHDFTIDENNEHIILYTDRPYKLLTYTIDGEFVKEERIKNFYFNMGYKDNNLLFLHKEERDKMFLEYDLETHKKKSFIDMNEKDSFFLSLGIESPNITKDKNVHISLPYSETIYEYDGNDVKPKYYIDFGAHKTPNNIINELEEDYRGLYKYITKNKYGFGISNFRENKNYITFNFYHAMIVIYSKLSKQSKVFKLFINDSDRLPFYNYFAHDGSDNKIISIYPAEQFKKQMSIYKEKEESWDKLPEYLKNMDEEVSTNSNPLLIVYTFKD